MRVLFATGSAAGYMRPPILGDEQIVCGPDWVDDRSSDGRVRSIKTPVGEYDLAAIAAKLPNSQKPDLVVCLVDAAWRNLPRNLAAFSCPKVLLIADTHHLTTPLMSMLRYMASEPYDRSVFLYDRHHASFFHAAGFRNLYWFPGLTFPHSDEKVHKARAQGVRQPQIAFVGQVGFLHPLRSRMFTTLIEKKLPVVQKKLSQDESLGFYGSSLLAFNASLNGDLNLRVFETLSAGATLLTDRLAPESGLERLLVDGREMLTYGSADELVEKATHALANPMETQAIGRAGSDWFDQRFNEAWRRKAFQELAFDGKPVPEFEFSTEEKTRVYFGGNTDRLLQAMMVYEGVQEIHRVEPEVKVSLDANVPDDVAAMYATLPRLSTKHLEKHANDVFDVAVFGRNVNVVPTARCLWCWDAQDGDADALAKQLGSAGYGLASRDVAMFCQVQQAMPDSYASASHWHYLGVFHRKHGKLLDALAALLQAVALNPEGIDSQMELGITALAYGHGMIAREAFTEVLRFRPNDKEAVRGLAKAKRREAACDYERPRDLLISHVEVTRLQGTGVLIQRFFPEADDFITVRSRSLYGNKVDFGGTHYAIDLPRISDEARAGILRRLLKPYRIRRIIAVPFFPTDYVHAVVAKEITGAPLCTYVMDDQVLYSKEVTEEQARRLFNVSDLRLAISPEMVREYEAWFGCRFGLLPPIITDRANEAPNAWDAAKVRPQCGALVGNIWSAQQFEQMRTFLRSAGMSVHWFGNANVPWLPQDKKELEQDGIFACGFLPEDQLAKRLSTYPYVVIPSGVLDGTENNEWLTRLSLPSRMVFILTKTQTPMLILGSADTAAARFVNQFGLGATSNYNAAEAPSKLRELTDVGSREKILTNARKVADHFLVVNCGEWIWQSLSAGYSLPVPFDPLYTELNRRNLPNTNSGNKGIAEIAQQLWSSLDAGYPLVERVNGAGDFPDEMSTPVVIPAGKTSAMPLPFVTSDTEEHSDTVQRLSALVRGKVVAFALHGSSAHALAERRTEIAAADDVVWVGLNHFSVLEDKFLKPANREFSIVFCCADGEVQRRLPALVSFLQRSGPRLLITRPDHLTLHKDAFSGVRDGIALELLPPLWPYPNSLTMCLRLLVQAGAKRIVLFGSDGYLGEDDSAIHTYIGSEEFVREKRYSGVLLDTLLYNAHMPQVMDRWRARLGDAFPEIVNCSPGTLVRAFPMIAYDEMSRALTGLSLHLLPVPKLNDLSIPERIGLEDPRPELVACANAARSGDLVLARQLALQVLYRAPARLSPLAARVLHTDTKCVRRARRLLDLCGASSPAALGHNWWIDLTRERKDAAEAYATDCWETWE